MTDSEDTCPLEEWLPGNGTRYELALIPLTQELDLFVWANAPRGVDACTKLSRGSTCVAWWFLDRINAGVADGAAILAWLARRGHRVAMPDGYGKDGLRDGTCRTCGRVCACQIPEQHATDRG